MLESGAPSTRLESKREVEDYKIPLLLLLNSILHQHSRIQSLQSPSRLLLTSSFQASNRSIADMKSFTIATILGLAATVAIANPIANPNAEPVAEPAAEPNGNPLISIPILSNDGSSVSCKSGSTSYFLRMTRKSCSLFLDVYCTDGAPKNGWWKKTTSGQKCTSGSVVCCDSAAGVLVSIHHLFRRRG